MQYDTPVEVSSEQLKAILAELGGGIAHRTDEHGRHWVKLWGRWAEHRLMEILGQQ